ncbi:MAG: hypothetical protein NZV61_08695, partial [Candidatus Bipolaricaulota bacterium]|nr:hypothetical protein [Candidatus Bipolaricaulota bacterium]
MYILNLPVRSSFLDLLPPGDPLLTKFQEREEIITKSDSIDIILMLQNPEHTPRDAERLKAAAEQIAQVLLAHNPEITAVSFIKDIQTRRGDELLSLRDEILLKLRQYQERLRSLLPTEQPQPSVPAVRQLITIYSQINTNLERIFLGELDWRRLALNPLELFKR